MKKITLILSLFLSIGLFAQTTETFSFESDEGYTLGPINGQNEWSVQEEIVNQVVVSDDESTDGSNSLFLEGLNSPFVNEQEQIVNLGTFSELFSLDNEINVLEFDIYLTDVATIGEEASDFSVQLQSTAEELLTSRIVFNFQDNIRVIDDGAEDPEFVNIGTFEREEWITVKIVHNFNFDNIEYFINDELLYTGNVWAGESVDQLVVLFDNFDSSAYIDNITLSDDPALSNEQFIEENAFVQYVNSNKLFMQANVNIENAQIFNMAGKQVANNRFNNNTEVSIDLNNFANGVYIVRVETENGNHSFKIVK